MKRYNLYFWQGEKRLIKRYLTRGELFDYLCRGTDAHMAKIALESFDADIQSLGYWNSFGWWHVEETRYKPF